MQEVPVWERYMLTVREASTCFHIGEKRIRSILKEHPDAAFVLRSGNRTMIRREAFQKYLDSIDSLP